MSRWIACATLALVACTSGRHGLGEQCSLNSECAEPLVCRLGRCRIECREGRDCPPGLLCYLVDQTLGLGVCQVPDEQSCEVTCPSTLVCNEAQCRAPCPSGAEQCVPDEACETRDGIDVCVADGVAIDAGPGPDAGPPTGRDAGPGFDAGPGTDAGPGEDGGAPALPGCADPARDACEGCEASLVTAGGQHTCAVRESDGRAFCWGDDSDGQVSGVPGPDANAPVAVGGVPDGVTSIAAGVAHTCAVVSGAVHCWGSPANGRLGRPDGGPAPRPVRGVSDAVEVAVGFQHSCARTREGRVLCWGGNGAGQLGRGSTGGGGEMAGDVVLDGPARALALGRDHACALTGGTLWCWGQDFEGSLGRGDARETPAAEPVPAAVAFSAGVAPVGPVGAGGAPGLAGAHTCAATDAGLFCWGRNDVGQVGDGSEVDRGAPVRVTPATITGLGLGGRHSCAIWDDTVHCWGANSDGRLGDGTMTSRNLPVSVATGPGVTAVSAGGLGALVGHSCAVVSGAVVCWGANAHGQLGVGELAGREGPTRACSLE